MESRLISDERNSDSELSLPVKITTATTTAISTTTTTTTAMSELDSNQHNGWISHTSGDDRVIEDANGAAHVTPPKNTTTADIAETGGWTRAQNEDRKSSGDNGNEQDAASSPGIGTSPVKAKTPPNFLTTPTTSGATMVTVSAIKSPPPLAKSSSVSGCQDVSGAGVKGRFPVVIKSEPQDDIKVS